MPFSTKDKKLISVIKQTVADTVREVLVDPDYGLELQPWVERRLRKYQKSKNRIRGVSLEEVKRKYL